ncbi:MAG: hypothetical protein IT332_01770 [Ardenticatenales bacterium]|nr:hypothetical protein [Ardenticatenales bacterium]
MHTIVGEIFKSLIAAHWSERDLDVQDKKVKGLTIETHNRFNYVSGISHMPAPFDEHPHKLWAVAGLIIHP